jgi:hypothetical protein
MSTGNVNKWHGSQVQILTGFESSSSSTAITSISKANPAVVTSSTHGLTTGDVVMITGVVGMTEVNDRTFGVNSLTTNTFELVDTNSSGYGAYVSGGSIAEGEFSEFCDLTAYNRQGGTSPEIPTTNICSVAQEYVIGLPDFGTTALDFNFDPLLSNVQVALHEAFLSGTQIAIRVVLPNSRGNMVQAGFVQQESEQAGNGTIWTASTTIRNTGNRYDYLPA